MNEHSESYIEFRCSVKDAENGKPCNGLLGGPSIETIESHEYSKGVFSQIVICRSCGSFVKISIKGIKDFPQIQEIKRKSKNDYCIKFIPASDFFGFVEAK